MDPFNFIESECQIPPSQTLTLSSLPFARHHPFPPSSAALATSADNSFSGNIAYDTAWPEFSSSGDTTGNIEYNNNNNNNNNVLTITICSAPPTPEPTQSADIADDNLGFPEFEKSKVSDDVVVMVTSEDKNDERESAAEYGGDTERVNLTDDEVLMGETNFGRDDVVIEETNLQQNGVVIEEASADRNGVVNGEDKIEGDNDVIEEVIREERGVISGNDEIDNVNFEGNLIDGEEKGGEVVRKSESKMGAESNGSAMKCLVEMLRVMTESENESGKKGDFLKTARRRGMTFPKPRIRRCYDD